jgi:hypothetical protein
MLIVFGAGVFARLRLISRLLLNLDRFDTLLTRDLSGDDGSVPTGGIKVEALRETREVIDVVAIASTSQSGAGRRLPPKQQSSDRRRRFSPGIQRSVYRLWPAVVATIFGPVLEPRLDRFGSCSWRRVPDPGCKFGDTLRPLIEGGLERPRQSIELGLRVLLRFSALGVVPDAGKVDDPESRDRQALQGDDAIGLAAGLHVDILMRAKDSRNASLPLLDIGKGCIDLLQNRCSPGSE